MGCETPEKEGDDPGLTDPAGVANVDHLDGDAVVVHARSHRVDAGEVGPSAAAFVVIAGSRVAGTRAAVSSVVAAGFDIVSFVAVAVT